MRRVYRLMTALMALGAMAAPANAGFNPRKLARTMPSEATEMAEGELQVTPIAYVRFCLNYASQCAPSTAHQRVELTAATWATLNEVNTAINERIAPDRSKGPFDWSVDTTYGNCNDYAVQKRKALLEKGFPSSALSLSTVLTSWGEGHLVLTVRTDHGDYVLDNLRPTILAWDRTGYEFNRVQSFDDPETWVHPVKAPRHVGPRFFRIDASFDAPVTDINAPAVVAAAAFAADVALAMDKAEPQITGSIKPVQAPLE